ncbi:YraN family protein [Clostridium formicaceticum]|uniref:UPF0102 protein BJL90_16630 n=1 Tax=Clostridium formicaceticum TaxID=1497 RepID=A0AAC9RIU3_9CLOT|nr:YraN family protein [Clostridium formicaceticum]AOY77332.1 YraN family protein [Clostridium formicaceticum]ARE87876.1 hypothetical protein CLFO_22760 [Clostridium formicaceticum]
MKKKTGHYGEQLSRKYFINKGYLILNSNYRTRLGEIDIIAQKDDTIIFVEVKTRKTMTFGLAREAVNYKKQVTLIKLAEQYIQYKKLKNMNFRFDVMEVQWNENKNQYEINHIENAF